MARFNHPLQSQVACYCSSVRTLHTKFRLLSLLKKYSGFRAFFIRMEMRDVYDRFSVCLCLLSSKVNIKLLVFADVKQQFVLPQNSVTLLISF